MGFNLLRDGFIPVMDMQGRPTRVGIRQALIRAGQLRELAATNPLDNVALLRFLLAVWMWCRPRLDAGDRQRLTDADGVPEDWLTQLGPPDCPHPAFELLGAGPRFFQERSADRKAKTSPIGVLLIEFPTATKIAHFRHVRDKQYGLCPACCALGLIRHCSFANRPGQGYTTSGLNGATPAYGLLQGRTLLQTLILNWQDAEMKRDPPWLCSASPEADEVDLPTAFSWRPRRLWLCEPLDGETRCAYCGAPQPLISELTFGDGWAYPFPSADEGKYWRDDPHLVTVPVAGRKRAPKAAGSVESALPATTEVARPVAAPTKQLRLPAPMERVARHAGFWREGVAALLGRLRSADAALVAPSATERGGTRYYDATALRLPAVTDPCAISAWLDVASQAAANLYGVLRASTPNPQREHPNRTAALDAFAPSIAAALRDELWRIMRQSPRIPVDRDGLRRLLAPVVERIVRATTPGSPLRRQVAVNWAEALLDTRLQRIDDAPGAEAPEPTTGVPTPQRGGPRRKRKGGAT